VARSLARRRYRPHAVAHELDLLLAQPRYAERALAAAQVIAQEDGVREVVRLVERMTAAEMSRQP
jgi:UDP:flavonoid glycosyltransferase YjiC (YdhE family)